MISDALQAKSVDSIFEIVCGNIVRIDKFAYKPTAIVNAAKPTLMGGGGVDGVIHGKINGLLGGKNNAKKGDNFNRRIKKELDGDENAPDNIIRCQPGEAVLTKGCKNFVKYIIHAVGPRYDGGSECMRTLEHCYESIMDIIYKNGSIKVVAIPVISSGNYGFPFELALKIAITSIGNSLIREKDRNYEAFAKLEKVYLVVYEERHIVQAGEIYREYEEQIKREVRMRYRSAWEAQRAYVKEIKDYDSIKRGYFTITKMFRLLLVRAKYLFPLSMLLQTWAGKKGWKAKREATEIETVVKMLIPVLFILMIQCFQKIPGDWLHDRKWILYGMCVIVAYSMMDTLLSLLSLIFLTDLYGPSANPMRTLILLIFNYMEMLFGIALFYYVIHWEKIKFIQALDYSFFGNEVKEGESIGMALRLVQYSKCGIEFFFLVLTFSFFVAHLRQREFMDR